MIEVNNRKFITMEQQVLGIANKNFTRAEIDFRLAVINKFIDFVFSKLLLCTK